MSKLPVPELIKAAQAFLEPLLRLFPDKRLRAVGVGVHELVVAIDPVNFEKPYTHESDGVSSVYESSPPNRKGTCG